MPAAPTVVATGLGVVSPVGTGRDAFLAGLLAGRSGGAPVVGYDIEGWRSRIACRVPDFDPADWIPAREVRRMDRTGHFGIAAARMALADAGLGEGAFDPERVAVVTGTCAPMEWVWTAHEACFTKGPRAVPPSTVLATFPDAAAARISQTLGLVGPCLTVSTACASGADAIGHAMLLLRAGRADVVIAGGVEAPIVPSALIAFGQARALSERNDTPETASRPFALGRDGFVMGEGAGLVVLERAEDARARGARICGEIAGYAASNDAYHMTAPDPEGPQRERAVRLALAEAGLTTDDLDWVSAHGTGTPQNDLCETRVLRRLLGPRADSVPVSAPKSMLGHGLGAAAGLAVAATLLCMEAGRIHPTINLDQPDPECDLDYVTGGARSVQVATALVEAFGFGGKNAALVLRRA